VAAGRGHLRGWQVTQRPVAILLLLAALGAAAQSPPPDLKGYQDALARGDYNAAAVALRPVADSGNPEAQYRYGMLLAEGLGVRPNDALAASWLRRAADQNHVEAQYQLGRMYVDGRGVPEDRGEAARLISRAADAGYAPAKALLRQLRP